MEYEGNELLLEDISEIVPDADLQDLNDPDFLEDLAAATRNWRPRGSARLSRRARSLRSRGAIGRGRTGAAKIVNAMSTVEAVLSHKIENLTIPSLITVSMEDPAITSRIKKDCVFIIYKYTGFLVLVNANYRGVGKNCNIFK